MLPHLSLLRKRDFWTLVKGIFTVAALVSLGACGNDSASSYTVGGEVSGLSGSGLVLQNNAGDDLAISADGAFTFATPITDGGEFAVTVKDSPTGPWQTCSVSNGTGRVSGAAVTNIQVVCSVDSYTIGGATSGLAGSGLVLQNNAGDDLAVAAEGGFIFATPVASGANYAVTVKTQPSNPSQTCTANRGTGVVTDGNISDVSVLCSTNSFTVSGTVNGLAGSGLVLQDNGGDDLNVAADGGFTFATAVASGANYAVTVKTQPSDPSQTCSVSNAAGTITDVAVSGVSVICSTNSYPVGGTVSGLAGSGLVLQNNAANDLNITADGSFQFTTPVASGADYAVTVKTQPSDLSQTCTVNNASGTITSIGISNISVLCSTNSYTVGGSVSGLAGNGLVLQNNAGDDVNVAADGSFTFNTPVASGADYAVTVKTQPSNPAQTCTVNNASGTVTAGNITDVSVLCSTNSYAVGGTVSGLAGSGLVLQNNAGDDLSIAGDGSFNFATEVASGADYAVTVKTSPVMLAQTCTVTAGSGTVTSAPVTTVQVDCVTPTPRFALVTQGHVNTVTSYAIDPATGAFINPPVATAATGNGPLSIAIDPTKRFVYVANVDSSNVSAYTVDSDTGILTPVSGSPYPTGLNPYLVTVDPAGHFLYVSNTNTSDISVFAIDSVTGALAEIAGSPFAAGAGSRSFQIAPSGVFGYGTAPTQVLAYQVNPVTGAISQIGAISPRDGGGGINVAVDPGGRFLYAPNYVWSPSTTVSAFTLDAGTGALAEVTGSPFAADGGAHWAVVEPSGRYAYVANLESSTVVAYSVDQASGALSRIGSYSAGATASDFVTADPSGQFIYVGNDWGTVAGFRIDPATGALTAMAGSPFSLPPQGSYWNVTLAILAK